MSFAVRHGAGGHAKWVTRRDLEEVAQRLGRGRAKAKGWKRNIDTWGRAETWRRSRAEDAGRARTKMEVARRRWRSRTEDGGRAWRWRSRAHEDGGRANWRCREDRHRARRISKEWKQRKVMSSLTYGSEMELWYHDEPCLGFEKEEER